MTALPEVLEKLERAASGPWDSFTAHNMSATAPPSYAVLAGPRWVAIDKDRALHPDDAAAMIAAVNWLREHGPALLRDAGDGWRSIESAPVGQLVVVCWRDEEDTDHPDRYEFDYLEDGVWQKHSDDYEHFCAVAPAGSRGPSEQAPYVGWRPLPPAMHAPGGAGGGNG